MEWKVIKGYDNYKINQKGEVKKSDEIVKPYKHNTRKTSYIVLVNKSNIGCSHHMSRLVYETFIEIVKDGYKINYKDSDPYNFCLDNLVVKPKWKNKTSKVPIVLDSNKKWKPVVGYEELYKISDHGDVYSIRRNKMLVNYLDGRGYYRIMLNKNKKKKSHHTHRLVYKTFINKNIHPDKVIDHIDVVKSNNNI